MTFNAVLALVGLAIVGATFSAGPTIPADVPWYWHTAIQALQGAAVAALLIVDPKDLQRIRAGVTTVTTILPAPPATEQ